MCSECGRAQQLRRGRCHACYERGRRRTSCALVDATPAKAKIAELLHAGWGSRRIAAAAGLDRSVITKIMCGQARITAKTRDALCGLHAEPDPAAIAHRELCEAGTRGDYISPQRKYRARQRKQRRPRPEVWIAECVEEIAALVEQIAEIVERLTADVDKQLAAERRKEPPLSFAEMFAELRHHCGLADWEIAKRRGVTNCSLLRQMTRDPHRKELSELGIEPNPQFVAMCVADKHAAAARKAAAQCA